jgi:transposase-like protein
MDTRQVKHQYLLSKWTPIVRECRTSGMTVKAWCQENNVDEKQFFYWERRVREELCTSVQTPEKEQPSVFAQLPIHTCHKETPQSDMFRPDLVISIGDYRLELANQTSPELLEAVLKVIHHV